MKVIGITGGSGVGKTTALACLAQRGALLIDCDALYHEMLRTCAPMLDELAARFPEAVADGVLDRKKLGALVFSDEAALRTLNEITHRYIRAEIHRRLAKAAEAGCTLAAIDAVALFEGDVAGLCDCTVAVTAPTEQRVARLMRRDGIDEAYARLRIGAQLQNEQFAARCDYTLENTCDSPEAFAAVCSEFFDRILAC